MSTAKLERILLVEDEIDIRMLAVMALEDVGNFVVETAAGGREAVARAADFCPDLVLLDYTMPDLDGQETLAALRQVPGLESTPAVFLTARTEEHEVAEYLANGAVDVIEKPFDAIDLAPRVEAIWRRYQASRESAG